MNANQSYRKYRAARAIKRWSAVEFTFLHGSYIVVPLRFIGINNFGIFWDYNFPIIQFQFQQNVCRQDLAKITLKTRKGLEKPVSWEELAAIILKQEVHDEIWPYSPGTPIENLD